MTQNEIGVSVKWLKNPINNILMVESDFKHILLFKTNIQTVDDKSFIAKVMEKQKVDQWTVDQQDVDCVLRIVSPVLKVEEVIHLVSKNGYRCEELT